MKALILLVLPLLLPVLPCYGQGSETVVPIEIHVSPGESIQEAIDQAPDGATIHLARGVWTENVVLGRPVCLVGAGQGETTIQGWRSCTPVVSVDCAGSAPSTCVRIEQLSIEAAMGAWCSGPPDTAVGVLVDGDTRVEIMSCAITQHSETGVHIAGASRVHILDCDVSENGVDGILAEGHSTCAIETTRVSGNYYSGIHANDSAEVHITDCRLMANEDAGVWGDSEIAVSGSGNTIAGNGVELVGNVSGGVRPTFGADGPDRVLYPNPAYACLQDAVDAVRPGGEIILSESVYRESIAVTQDLTIRAEDGLETELIAATEWVPAISVVGDAALGLRGITVSDGQEGAVLGASASLEAEQCEFSYNRLVGVRAQDSASLVLKNCLIESNGYGDGIEVSGAATASLEHCRILDHYGDGVVMIGDAEVRIQDSAVMGNDCGLRVEDLASLQLDESDVSYNYDCGVRVVGSDARVLGRDNTVTGNGLDFSGNVTHAITLPSREPTEMEIVYPGDDYETLQDCVDALLPGGRLLLRGGTHRGSIVVWRDLDIQPFEGGSAAMESDREAGPTIEILDKARVRISEITIRSGADGIRASGSAYLEVAESAIIANKGHGICLYDEARARISSCELAENDCGLGAHDAASAEIQDTEVFLNAVAGLRVSSSASITGARNKAYANGQDADGDVSEAGIETCGVGQCAVLLYPSSSHDTAQQAVDALPVGGELVLCEGSHSANLVIDREISVRALQGRSPRLVVGEAEQPCISVVSGGSLSLTGIAIAGGGEGLAAEGDARLAMTNCVVSAMDNAATFSGTCVATLSGCRFQDNAVAIEVREGARLELESTRIERTTGHGLSLYDSSAATVIGCQFSDNKADYDPQGWFYILAVILRWNGCGISANDSSSLEVRDSVLERNGHGIDLTGDSVGLVESCSVSDSDVDGVSARDGSWIRIVNCTVEGGGEMGDGVYLKGSAEAEIEACTVQGNGAGGLHLDGSARADVRLCDFASNGAGGLLLQSASHVTILDSAVSDHAKPGASLSGKSTIELTSCKLERNEVGLGLSDSAIASVRQCEFLGNTVAAVAALASASLELESSTLQGNEAGVLVGDSVTASLRGNGITDTEGVAVAALGASSLELAASTLQRNESGVLVSDSAEADLSGNEIVDTHGVAVAGQSLHPVRGVDNRFDSNILDLKGNVLPSVRAPRVPPNAEEVIFPSDDYGTLQTALDALRPEGTLWIREGEYSGHLTVSSTVTISSYPGEIAALSATSDEIPVISLIPGSAMDLRGIEIHGGSAGVYAFSAPADVSDCRIDGSPYGVELDGTASLRMNDSTVSECTVGGISLSDDARAQLERCFLFGNHRGVSVSDAAEARIDASGLSGQTDAAAEASGSSLLRITRSLLVGNGEGIWGLDSAQCEVEGNTIAGTDNAAIVAMDSATIVGSENLLLWNGIDLLGNVDASLRLRLAPETEDEIVYPSREYGSLQEAIDALRPGGRILLQAGSYEESVTIYKRVNMSSLEDERAVLHGAGEAFAVITVVADGDLTLSSVDLVDGEIAVWSGANAHVRLDSCAIASFETGGVWSANSSTGQYERCEFTDIAGTCLLQLDTAVAEVANSTIQSTSNTAIAAKDRSVVHVRDSVVGGSETIGVSAEGNASVDLQRITVAECGVGVAVTGEAHLRVEGCRIEKSVLEGVKVQGEAVATIVDSVLSSNRGGGCSAEESSGLSILDSRLDLNRKGGILASGSARVTVEGCRIGETLSDGVQLAGSAGLEAADCEISGNILSGLYLSGNAEATLVACVVQSNSHGIELADSAVARTQECVLAGNRYSAADLSNSSRLTASGDLWRGNTLGSRLRGTSSCSITDTSILGNSTGMLFLGEAAGVLRRTALRFNSYDGISVWGSGQVTLGECVVTGNLRQDVSTCGIPVEAPADSQTESTIVGCGESRSYPDAIPEDVLDARESVVVVDVKGYEPGSDEILWVDANGVVVGADTVLTCWHLFMGEEDITQSIDIDALEILSPEDGARLAETADLLGMSMDRAHDSARLLIDADLPPAFLLAEIPPPPQDVVWYVGSLDGVWYTIPGIVAFPERSCAENFLDVVAEDGTVAGELWGLLPDAYATLRDATQHGLSGGAVVRSDGRLVGILGPRPCDTDLTMGIWGSLEK